MMDGAVDQDEGLARGTGAVLRRAVEGRRVGRRGPPRVLLPVDHGQARVRDVEAAVLVDCGGVGGRGDVECIGADEALVFEGVGAGD